MLNKVCLDLAFACFGLERRYTRRWHALNKAFLNLKVSILGTLIYMMKVSLTDDIKAMKWIGGVLEKNLFHT